jgi:hypothetical protein
MSALTIALMAFVCMFGGALLGACLRPLLPGHHVSADSRDVVKLGVGVIATQAALVLGLLVSSAKGSFDTMNAEITQAGAKIILLDHVLARYGAETHDARQHVQRSLRSTIDSIWPTQRGGASGMRVFESSTTWEEATDTIWALTPQTEAQRVLKAQALQMASELAQLRWLSVEQSRGALPTIFLIVLIFWFAVLFVTFGVLTPRNATVMTVLLVCALAVAGGVLLVLEMNRPLEGVMKASSAPLEHARDHLGR